MTTIKHSNTTLVKVKLDTPNGFKWIKEIQIQHLLKLNIYCCTCLWCHACIQIQHLLKLNGTDKNTMISQENSNTTLVKVKLA